MDAGSEWEMRQTSEPTWSIQRARVKSSVEHAAEIESLYERVLSGNQSG